MTTQQRGPFYVPARTPAQVQLVRQAEENEALREEERQRRPLTVPARTLAQVQAERQRETAPDAATGLGKVVGTGLRFLAGEPQAIQQVGRGALQVAGRVAGGIQRGAEFGGALALEAGRQEAIQTSAFGQFLPGKAGQAAREVLEQELPKGLSLKEIEERYAEAPEEAKFILENALLLIAPGGTQLRAPLVALRAVKTTPAAVRLVADLGAKGLYPVEAFETALGKVVAGTAKGVARGVGAGIRGTQEAVRVARQEARIAPERGAIGKPGFPEGRVPPEEVVPSAPAARVPPPEAAPPMIPRPSGVTEPVAAVPPSVEAVQAPSLPPPGKPPAPPGAIPPSAFVPPAAAGNRFLGDFRSLEEHVAEVVTSDNPFVRIFVGRTGINPSVLERSPVGKIIIAHERQRIAAEQLKETALASALDVQTVRLPIDQEGFWGKTGKLWQDVFSRPSAYSLNSGERVYIGAFNQVVQEAEALRVAHGLKPLGRTEEGWFYVPRQVKGIRGIELRRPSSPKLQRIYEEATEGFGKGVRYDSNPRATLELHLRATLREITEKELSDALEPLSITPKALVAKTVLNRLESAIKARRTEERAVRAEIAQARKDLARSAETERQIAARKEDLAKLESLVHVEGPARVAVVRTEYEAAKRAYTKALEAARRKEVAQAELFARPELSTGEIPVAQWRNRFFPREEADRLREALGFFGAPRESLIIGGLEKLANSIRFLASVGDFSAPFIQGLPLLARHPLQWAKVTAQHYRGWFDTKVQARYIRENIAMFQEMARYGVPVGDTEFFRALQPGGGFSAGQLIARLPKGEVALDALNFAGRQTFGRFQSSYNVFLTMARGELWKAHRQQFAGNLNELGAFLRNMTGGLDSRALGVGPAQRAAEGMWLAFSPRLLRSTVGLLASSAKLGTVQGREAARTLAQLVAGVVGIYVAAGIALGKREEEIVRGLNPLSGKYFLSHEINGDLIGVGGQIRALTQMMAGVVSAVAPGGKSLGDLASLNRWDNPFIQFWMFRGAPALNIALGTGEAVTGANLDPFKKIQSTPDLLLHLGTSALPFAVQGMLEGEQTLTMIAAILGARTSPLTKTERKRKRLRSRPQQPIIRRKPVLVPAGSR